MTDDLFQNVSNSLALNQKYIEATNKNVLYVHYGSDSKRDTTFSGSYFATEEFFDNLSDTSSKPDAFNPYRLNLLVLFQEINQANLATDVFPNPGFTQEPFLSFSKTLKECLDGKFEPQKKFFKSYLLELLTRGMFILFFDNHRVHHLTINEFFVGDYTLSNLEEQPFVGRITSIRRNLLEFLLKDKRTNKEVVSKLLESCGPFDKIKIYDVFSKSLNLRRIYSPGGSIIWEDEFPKPFKYPFALILDSVDLSSFYTVPIITKQQKIVDKHIELNKSIDKSTHSVARPLLVYDAEARINDESLKQQLMEGNKNIMLGKSAAGDVRFISPGILPQYVYSMSSYYDSVLKAELGISAFQLGQSTGGIREAGAIQSMLRSSNRSIAYYSSLIAQGFEDLANYILQYYRENKLTFMNTFKLDEPSSIKFTNAGFYARCTLTPSISTKSLQDQMFAMKKWQSGLISWKMCLEEMGYKNPNEVISQVNREQKERAVMANELQKPGLSIEDQIRLRLLRIIGYDPKIIDVHDKFVVKVKEDDINTTKFALSDFEEKVLIVPDDEKVKTIEVGFAPSETETAKTEESKPETEAGIIEKLRESMPGAEASEKPESPESETPKKPAKKSESIPFTGKKELRAGAIHSPKGFSMLLLNKLVERSKRGIKAEAVHKYLDKFPGLYLVEPHALRISKGEKILLVKSRLFDIKDKPHILAGDYLYGIIIPRFVWRLKPGEFEKLEKYHTITSEERKKWWGDSPLYGYMFEFHRFEKPVEYIKKPGVQNFIKAPIELRSEKIGVPYTGDLKPIELKPFKVPPPAKPEKKAFAPYELFDPQRVAKVIPDGRYNVSEKIDGIRCFIWKNGEEIKAFSSQGNEIEQERIKPVIDSVADTFKGDILLDGELILKGGIHQDIAGYINSKSKPTEDDLKRVFYYVFDILYLNGKQLADKPFIERSNVLNLYIRSGQQKDRLIRVKNINVYRKEIPEAMKKVASKEGVIIREINSAYWATHLMFKCKFLAEIDVKVLAVEKTKLNLPIFHCVLKDGTYIGQTYAQSEVFAKEGDIIRVQVDHFTLRPDGSIGWFAPKTTSIKEKIKPHASLTQPGIKEADTLMLIKEKVLADGLPVSKWNTWYPKHLEWKEKKMPALIKRIISKIKAGVPASKT